MLIEELFHFYSPSHHLKSFIYDIEEVTLIGIQDEVFGWDENNKLISLRHLLLLINKLSSYAYKSS